MSLCSSGHKKLDICSKSSFSFLSAIYLPFGVNSGRCSGNFGRSLRGLSVISLIILNLSGSIPSTGFTFKATGLYFLAKQTASAASLILIFSLFSFTAITVFLTALDY